MRHAKKVYGYTIALWEIGKTVHGLFRFTSDYKKRNKIPTTKLWRSMIDPSWAPIFLRPFLGSLSPQTRNSGGDAWNLCHLWSNFEIADMDFFRSEQYRAYFDALDREGGFYYQRVSTLNMIGGWLLTCTYSGEMPRCILLRQPYSWNLSSSIIFLILVIIIDPFSTAQQTHLEASYLMKKF